MTEVFGTAATVTSLSLPALAVLAPLVGAALVLLFNRYGRWRDVAAVVTSAASFIFIVAMYPLVIAKGEVISLSLPKYVFGIGLNFSVDPMSFLFALFTSLVWLIAIVYSINYMEHEKKHTRYYFFMLISLAANIGVVVTGDFFSLFIFFEILGVFSYPLVIHSETKEALKAGTKYMLMNLIGGVVLLAGILLLFYYGRSFQIASALEALNAWGNVKYFVAALMIIGFGVKAGFVPLHIWLPDAHPVAPSPASALLSGIMIKAGAYGIIRTVAVVFRPPIHAAGVEIASKAKEIAAWQPTMSMGYYIIWLGIMTMMIAAILALLQSNAKRLLAYSSVSQMGYIIMGVGVGTFMAAEGSIGLGGAIFHILNHALFKSTFFLTIGAVYFATHELNIYKLGGMWRKLPVVTVAALVSAAGITGLPLFNGYASKALLFEGIKFAAEHNAEHAFGPVPLIYAQWLYLIVSALTTAYILKYIIHVFFGKLPKEHKDVNNTPIFINSTLGIMAAMIFAIGLFPNFVLEKLVLPVIAYWQLPLAELSEIHFFTFAGLEESLLVIAAGALVYVAGTRYEYFLIKFPDWVSIDYFYQLVAKQVYPLANAANIINNAYEAAFMKIVPWIMSLKKPASKINKLVSRLIFAITVDMWLFKPITPTAAQSLEGKEGAVEDISKLGGIVSAKVSKVDQGYIDRFVDEVSHLGEEASVRVGKVDLGFIDRIITVVAIVGEWLSILAGLSDKYIVDGAVNGIGWLVQKSGRKLRPLQTGDVQSYGLVMVAGAIIIIIFFALAFYGVFKLF